MEKRNLFVSGKAVVAAVCGAFTAAFGWLGWLVVAWAACMALDWVSGSAAAEGSRPLPTKQTVKGAVTLPSPKWGKVAPQGRMRDELAKSRA